MADHSSLSPPPTAPSSDPRLSPGRPLLRSTPLSPQTPPPHHPQISRSRRASDAWPLGVARCSASTTRGRKFRQAAARRGVRLRHARAKGQTGSCSARRRQVNLDGGMQWARSAFSSSTGEIQAAGPFLSQQLQIHTKAWDWQPQQDLHKHFWQADIWLGMVRNLLESSTAGSFPWLVAQAPFLPRTWLWNGPSTSSRVLQRDAAAIRGNLLSPPSFCRLVLEW